MAESARHRKDCLARCRRSLQQQPHMCTGRMRSSCAVVPSRRNHCDAARSRTRSGSHGTSGALHALYGDVQVQDAELAVPTQSRARCAHAEQSSLCPRRAHAEQSSLPTQSPRRAEPTQSPRRAELAHAEQSSLCPRRRRARCAHAELAVPTLQPKLCPHCIRPCHGAPIVRCSCAVRLLPHRAVAIVRCSRPVLLQSPWGVAIVRCR